jgi:hypothetical protein
MGDDMVFLFKKISIKTSISNVRKIYDIYVIEHDFLLNFIPLSRPTISSLEKKIY